VVDNVVDTTLQCRLAGIALFVALIPLPAVRMIVLTPMPFLNSIAGRGAYLLLYVLLIH
jgi:hypothetical protein